MFSPLPTGNSKWLENRLLYRTIDQLNKHRLIGGENRLIYRTLAQIQEQQRRAGTTVSGTAPVNARAAQTASTLQNANADTKGVRIGSNEFADRVEANVKVNLSPGDWAAMTPAQQEAHTSGMALADASRFTAAPGSNPAKGVMTAQQSTYANQEAGLGTSFNRATGVTQTSSQSGLEQSAINRLRESGKKDEEIRAIMSAPEYKQNIQQTMGNTGLGGTARRSAVLTLAQAQQILSTSRNPRERAEAEKAIKDIIDSVKGYDQIPQYNKDGQLTGYTSVINAGKSEENQQREKERQTLEASNRLKSQEAAEKLKKFTAGIDTTQIDQTKAQIDGIMASIANLSPDLQAAVLPSLISLQIANNEVAAQVNAMIAAQPTDAEIEGDGSLEKYINSQDEKYKEMIAKNLDTAKEVATYNRDMIQADKDIFEHDATVSEQKQLAANVQNEKQLRRQLNRLGIQTDVQGLDYLQTEIQNGVDTLENLKTANNLVSLKAQLAIGKGYSLEVKQAMEGYEANYLNITSQTTERRMTAENSISTAKEERNKEIIAARKWGMEQKQENDKELRNTISGAHKTMNDALKDKRDNDAKIAERRETMAKSLFFDAFNNSTDTAYRQSAVDMMKNAGYDLGNVDVNNLTLDQQLKIVDMQKKKAAMNATNPYNYTDPVEIEIMNAAALAAGNAPGDGGHRQFLIGKVAKFVQAGDYKGANDFINSIAASGLGVEGKSFSRQKTMIDIASSAIENLTDMAENGGSRNIYAMTWNKAKNLAAFSQNSDFIALTTEIAQLSAEELNSKSGAAITEAEFNRLRTYVPQPNDTVKDALIKMEKFANVLKAKNQDMLDRVAGRIQTDNYQREKADTDTNVSPYDNRFIEDEIIKGSGPGSTPLGRSGEEAFSYSSLGRETQNFNTVIASRANGGLYDESTVKAWNGRHAGIDIAISQGTNLPSKVGGEVIEVGYNDGWGGTIVIRDTNGGEHRFSHLSNLGVKKGDIISSGQIIAKTGGAKGTKGAGNSTGAHLDYRIKKDGKYVDPNTYQYS